MDNELWIPLVKDFGTRHGCVAGNFQVRNLNTLSSGAEMPESIHGLLDGLMVHLVE